VHEKIIKCIRSLLQEERCLLGCCGVLAESFLVVGCRRGQPLNKRLLDVVSCVGKCWSIGRIRGSQVNTVCAIVAVDEDVLHARLGVRVEFPHARVLPGVFNGVSEYDLLASDVNAAVVLVVPVDCWRTGVVIEDVLAPLEPEVGAQEV